MEHADSTANRTVASVANTLTINTNNNSFSAGQQCSDAVEISDRFDKPSTPPSHAQHYSRLPQSPIVTPPVKMGDNNKAESVAAAASVSSPTSTNSKSNSATKKGVPHIYHDYAELPDKLDYTRKKTGGVTQVRKILVKKSILCPHFRLPFYLELKSFSNSSAYFSRFLKSCTKC